MAQETERKSSETKDKDADARASRASEEFKMVSPMQGRGMPASANNPLRASDEVENEIGVAGPVAREYHIGVIDFLTKYSLNKVAERTLKSFKYEKKALSVAPPSEYAERFVAFAEGICVGHEPPRELPGGGYLVQVILKQHKTAGLELGNKNAGGGVEAAWKGSMSKGAAAADEGANAGGAAESPLQRLDRELATKQSGSGRGTRGSLPGGGGGGEVAAAGGQQWLFSSAGTNHDRFAVKSGNAAALSSSRPAGRSSSIKDVGGVVCLAVKEGCECALVGIRAGDRVHRINGDLVPTTLGFGAVQARLSSATRPLYLTLERWPSRQDEQSASKQSSAAAVAAQRDAAAAAKRAEMDRLRLPLPSKTHPLAPKPPPPPAAPVPLNGPMPPTSAPAPAPPSPGLASEARPPPPPAPPNVTDTAPPPAPPNITDAAVTEIAEVGGAGTAACLGRDLEPSQEEEAQAVPPLLSPAPPLPAPLLPPVPPARSDEASLPKAAPDSTGALGAVEGGTPPESAVPEAAVPAGAGGEASAETAAQELNFDT
jgi:hypothetical protein